MTFPAHSHPDAAVWAAHAAPLTERAAYLVNRLDVWGQYIAPARRTAPDRKSWTAPTMRDRGAVSLTAAQVRAHFAGRCVIGLHAQSDDTTGAQVSRWCGFDLDAHNDATATADAAANHAAALRLVDTLEAAGAVPLVELSCDRGGRHVWVQFDAPAPTPDVYAWALSIQRTADVTGETFPKQQGATFGNWLRLPGPHHTRVWWSQFVAGGAVLAGADAVAHFLAWGTTPAHIVPPAPVRESAPLFTVAPSFMRTDDRLRRLAAYVRKVPTGLRLGDHRNDTAYRLAARCLEDVGAADAFRIVAAWNADNTQPLSDRDLSAIIANAGRHRRGAA
jgi:hypothetical protein